MIYMSEGLKFINGNKKRLGEKFEGKFDDIKEIYITLQYISKKGVG